MTDDRPVTELVIDDDRVALVVTRPDGTGPVRLELGPLGVVLDRLAHEPATPGELEAAIADIEDALMPLLGLLPAEGALVTAAGALRELAQVVSPSDETRLELATVEHAYHDLAAVAEGAAAKRRGIPESREFAAMLLIVREVMHHGGFSAIAITRSSSGRAGPEAR